MRLFNLAVRAPALRRRVKSVFGAITKTREYPDTRKCQGSRGHTRYNDQFILDP
jgi:hypothetical protein